MAVHCRLRLLLPVLLVLLQNTASQHEQEPETEDDKFLEENGKRDAVQTTESGLQYEVIKSGPEDGSHPEPESKCVVHYRGQLLNGVEFDSSYKRNAPATFSPSRVVPGFKEALLLMRPGDSWKVWLPSQLGYGSSGAGSSIPANAALLFELELLEVQPPAEGLEWVKDQIMANPMMLVMVVMLGFQVYNMMGGGGGAAGKQAIKIEEAMGQPENSKVFFNIKIGDDEAEKVEMELFTKHYPKTAENFRALCTGEKGKGKQGKDLSFKGSIFHRIIPGFMCQGGDFTRGNGTGGESIYGNKFADEFDNGYITHNAGGLLSMANSGKDTNGSQFFITLASCTHLDGKHVVFGKVTDGMDVVKKMAAVGSSSGSTSKKVLIEECGESKSKST
eukprot:TRINITY_DN92942_c0_g1_i1.p1 TRINITY_DN92942_c0_g1~~TRINITY_DN92942_c0_g1_i1.p1  ORF type:complete len:410 (+),score=104.85 TRINITY_DN92942_c0_g1_i1:62-1231(+)